VASPGAARGADWWIRFGGGASLFTMGDFNDGVEQMNALVADAYRLAILDRNPGIGEGELAAAVAAATEGKQLETLDSGLTVAFAVARRLASALSVGLEYERIFDANDRVADPETYMYYTAPASLYKAFLEADLLRSGRATLGVAGGVGYARASGYLVMPANVDRTRMKEAYLSGGGLLFEGAAVVSYTLAEDVAVTAQVGYRMTDLSESDQNWFGENHRVTPDPRAIPLQSIPLKLDYGGVLLKLGLTVALR
jgi:hypothetical protein